MCMRVYVVACYFTTITIASLFLSPSRSSSFAFCRVSEVEAKGRWNFSAGWVGSVEKMQRAWMQLQMAQRRRMCHATALVMGRQELSASASGEGTSSAVAPTSIAPGPYRRVGNIFIVHCEDHPFKHSWEVNRMLRELRLEFRGQTSIAPDIPLVRKQLWRVRHVVQVDMLDLDEAKALIGVPEHISFCDLLSQVPASFGRVRAVANPVLRSKMNFMKLRRMRLRDVLHRDTLELRLLEEKRKLLAAAQQQSHQISDEQVKEEAALHTH